MSCYCCSVAKSGLTLWDPTDLSKPGFPVLHYLSEFYVHWVDDAIQLSHPLLLPSALNLSQHRGLLQWVSSSYHEAKVLELQHQNFQWIFNVDFLQDWLVWSPCCPRDSLESSLAPQFERINSLALNLLYGPARTCIHDYWKNHSFALYGSLSVKWSLRFLICCLGLSLNTLTVVILIFVLTYPITKFPVNLFPLLFFFFLNIQSVSAYLFWMLNMVCERVQMSLEPLNDTVPRRLCFLIWRSGKSGSL